MLKVISIEINQLYQLIACKKTFTVLYFASWHMKSYNKLVSDLKTLPIDQDDSLLFKVIIEINSESEEYVLWTLRLKDFPTFVAYKKGIVQNITNNLELDSTFLKSDEFLTFHKDIGFLSHLISSNQNGIISSCGKVFISGDRSSVGKSSICLAILISLIKLGMPPHALAYIKPVTQCEAEQPVIRFCDRLGITHRAISPIVFYKGFTRAYLNNETSDSNTMLNDIKMTVDEISRGKLITIVDGVGYPSVGSICNISNAQVAKELHIPVLLIGKSGVGDAVDSYNLNSTYFESYGVKVLGGIFNKFPIDGYYALDSSRTAIMSYFQQFKNYQMPYGFLPIVDELKDLICNSTDDSAKYNSNYSNATIDIEHKLYASEMKWHETFINHVDLDRLIHDIWCFEVGNNLLRSYIFITYLVYFINMN